ncbi:MAG: ANTAR domain-containing protein [Blautia sp.]|nr:ANTAR domain-containing protein [Blautia sp.]
MSFKERIYSVLIVSSADKLTASLSSLLAESHCHPVKVATRVSEAKRVWGERTYDYLIINSPLPDDSGIRFAIDAVSARGAVVLLLVRGDLYAEVTAEVSSYGIYTLQKPLSRPIFYVALDWMEATRERLKKLEEKTLSVEEKMKEIRLVNRAKWLLISELQMDEPRAHRYIEKQAMDRCITKREVAEDIIKTYS